MVLVDGAGGGSTGGDKQTFEDEAKKNMIGKTITGYNPSFNAAGVAVQAGTIADGKYTPEDQYTGREESDTEQGAFDTESLGWRIWSIDENNIYLISKDPTTTQLTLKGAQGYNNGVLILNEICKTCYTDSDYAGVEVRSMNAEDLKKVITAPNENGEYGATPYPYNFQYPNAYWTYDKEKGELENRHKQDNVITGVLESAQSSRPRNSYYHWRGSTLGVGGSWTNEAYKDLYNPGEDYWLASRSVDPYTKESCFFGLQRVLDTAVGYETLYYYSRGSAKSFRPHHSVRPLVSVPLTSCTISGPNDQEEYSIEAKNH